MTEVLMNMHSIEVVLKIMNQNSFELLKLLGSLTSLLKKIIKIIFTIAASSLIY